MTDTSEGIVQNARNLFARWHAFQSHVGPYRERVRKSGIEFDLLSALEPDEMQLSRMFADFLNPEGSHGQGAVFLQALLDYVWPVVKLSEKSSVTDTLLSDAPPREIQSAKVDVEYGIEGLRRIDITVEAKFSATESIWIGIENKPWAIEQKDQLKNYYSALERKTNKIDDKPIVLFWHGSGRKSDTKDDIKRIIEMSYVSHNSKNSVADWLKICRGLTRAPEVWQGILMLERYIESNFSNEVLDAN